MAGMGYLPSWDIYQLIIILIICLSVCCWYNCFTNAIAGISIELWWIPYLAVEVPQLFHSRRKINVAEKMKPFFISPWSSIMLELGTD